MFSYIQAVCAIEMPCWHCKFVAGTVIAAFIEHIPFHIPHWRDGGCVLANPSTVCHRSWVLMNERRTENLRELQLGASRSSRKIPKRDAASGQRNNEKSPPDQAGGPCILLQIKRFSSVRHDRRHRRRHRRRRSHDRRHRRRRQRDELHGDELR
jgi:hypothetical protein